MAITILLLYVVKGVCSYLSTTLVAAVGQRAVTDLRNALYEHVLEPVLHVPEPHTARAR